MSKLLDVKIIPHRSYLMADTPDQKLFIELKLQANRKTDFKPNLSIAFIIDTSGSMREIVAGSPVNTGKMQTMDGSTYNIVAGGDSKIGILIDGLKKFVDSAKLKNTDRVSLIKFDDKADVLLPFVNIESKNKDLILNAIDSLINYSGGTSMGAGMKEALNLMSKETGNRKIILLTDGQTCRPATASRGRRRARRWRLPSARARARRSRPCCRGALSRRAAGCALRFRKPARWS